MDARGVSHVRQDKSRLPVMEPNRPTPVHLRHIAPELNFRSITHYMDPSGAMINRPNAPRQHAQQISKSESDNSYKGGIGQGRETTAWGQASGRSNIVSSHRPISAKRSHFNKCQGFGSSGNLPIPPIRTKGYYHFERMSERKKDLERQEMLQNQLKLSDIEDVELEEQGHKESQSSFPPQGSGGVASSSTVDLETVSQSDSRSSIAPFTTKPSRAKSLAWKLRANVVESFKAFSAQSLNQFSEKGSPSDSDEYLEDITDLKRPRRANIRRNMGCCELLAHDFRNWFRRQKRKKIEIPILNRQVYEIEALFGSGIASFFVFTRWVVLLNLFFGLMWLGVIVMPQVVAFDYGIFKNTTFYIQNLFDGEDALSLSWLFYGGYSRTLGTIRYPLFLAYFWMILMTYFGSLFITFRSIAIARQYNMAHPASNKGKFSMIVFTSWDYSIQNSQAAQNLSAGIRNTLRDLEHESRAKKKQISRSKRYKLLVSLRRIVAWFLTFCLIGLGCGIIILLASSDLVALLKTLGYKNPEKLNFLSVYGTPIVFTLINIIIPPIVYQLPRMENYVLGKTELNISIGRVFVLRIANIIALIISLHQKVNRGNSTICTGTLLGQELYKLVLLDTIVQFFLQLVPPLVKFKWKKQKEEFRMAKIVLGIVYRQGLIWAGTLVCPLMPLLGAFSMMVIFKVNYTVVTKACIPPMKRWSQSRYSSFFISLLAATLIILIVFISLITGSNDIVKLGQIGQSNATCGPFEGESVMSSFTVFKSMYLEEQWMVTLMKFVFSTAVLVPLVFLILAVLYFQGLNLKSQNITNKILSSELEHEREENLTMIRRLDDQRESIRRLIRHY